MQKITRYLSHTAFSWVVGVLLLTGCETIDNNAPVDDVQAAAIVRDSGAPVAETVAPRFVFDVLDYLPSNQAAYFYANASETQDLMARVLEIYSGGEGTGAQFFANSTVTMVGSIDGDEQDRRFYGLFLGRYPAALIQGALQSNPGWQRNAPSFWEYLPNGFQIHVISNNLLSFANGDLDALENRLEYIGSAGLPHIILREIPLHGAMFYVREPSRGYVRPLIGGGPTPSIESFVVWIDEGDRPENYAISGWVLFGNEIEARAFGVLLRLVLVGIAQQSGFDANEIFRTLVVERNGVRIDYGGLQLNTEQMLALAALAGPQR